MSHALWYFIVVYLRARIRTNPYGTRASAAGHYNNRFGGPADRTNISVRIDRRVWSETTPAVSTGFGLVKVPRRWYTSRGTSTRERVYVCVRNSSQWIRRTQVRCDLCVMDYVYEYFMHEFSSFQNRSDVLLSGVYFFDCSNFHIESVSRLFTCLS